MTQSPQQPQPWENKVVKLERDTSELRIVAEALLQTAQIHQSNFETIGVELNALKQLHRESDQRFEIMLAELRQMKIDSDIRFNGLQTEIRRVIDRLFDGQNDMARG